MAENTKKWEETGRRYRSYIKLEKRLSENTVESYMRDYAVRALHPAPVRRRAPQGRTADGRTLHGVALRARTRKDLAGPRVERHQEFLQLPDDHRQDRIVARRVRRYAQIRTPAARHPDHRRDRPHHRHRRHALDQRAARQRHARSALLVRPARLGTDVAALADLFFGEGYIRVIGKGDKQRTGADQFNGPRQIQRYLEERRSVRTGEETCFSTTAADSSRA